MDRRLRTWKTLLFRRIFWIAPHRERGESRYLVQSRISQCRYERRSALLNVTLQAVNTGLYNTFQHLKINITKLFNVQTAFPFFVFPQSFKRKLRKVTHQV